MGCSFIPSAAALLGFTFSDSMYPPSRNSERELAPAIVYMSSRGALPHCLPPQNDALGDTLNTLDSSTERHPSRRALSCLLLCKCRRPCVMIHQRLARYGLEFDDCSQRGRLRLGCENVSAYATGIVPGHVARVDRRAVLVRPVVLAPAGEVVLSILKARERTVSSGSCGSSPATHRTRV